MAGRRAFDVAIVGGGAAGCVVAARLSESGERSVLLLEAGPDLRSNAPDEIRDGWHMTRDFDWGFTSEPNELGGVLNLRRGKMIGGTSSITRFALRGAPADYDEWEALGNPGWGFDSVLPYLKRVETDTDFGALPHHGNSGPIPVTRYRDLERPEIHAALAEAIEAVGFPRVEDHNRPGAVGVGPMPMSSRDGVRVSAADAYLPVGRTPRNLTIRPDAHVAEVVLDVTRATGVRLVDGTVIDAGRVVLCGGTYGSPPLLMRSGIGPADHLRSLGISVVVDLPGVGSNLADHPQISFDSGFSGASRSTPVLHSAATFRSRSASADEPPDLMFWIADPGPVDSPPQLEIEIILLKPESRGTVRLRSANSADPPRIELPALQADADLERLAEGYRRGLDAAMQPVVRNLCEGAPPAAMSDEDLHRTIRENRYSIPHVVGTCAMGRSPAGGAVVDASGRVHGTDALFVVDASIMPTVPSGFTHLPTMMIAERLSEEIAATF